MPQIMVPLSQDEFDRLRDRAKGELRHPRHTARLLLREALSPPPREPRVPTGVIKSTNGTAPGETEHATA